MLDDRDLTSELSRARCAEGALLSANEGEVGESIA